MLGRANHLFFECTYDPKSCMLFECEDKLETLEENLVTVKLCTKTGLFAYLDPSNYKSVEALIKKFPLTLIINDSEEQI